MIIPLVLDPDALEASRVDGDAGNVQSHALQLLKHLRAAGVLLVDDRGLLVSRMRQRCDSVRDLAIQKLLEQLLVQYRCGSRRAIMVPCSASLAADSEQAYPLAVVKELAQAYGPEAAVVASSEDWDSPGHVPAVALRAYVGSDLASSLETALSQRPSLDKIGLSQAEKLIRPALQFSKVLRIYDYVISAHKTANLKSYLRGISWIVDFWTRHISSSIATNARLEIYSRYTSMSNCEQVESELLIPLSRMFRHLNISFISKQDTNRVIHRRWLESDCAIICFDSGFDIYKLDSDILKRNILSLDNDSYIYTRENRQLHTRWEWTF